MKRKRDDDDDDDDDYAELLLEASYDGEIDCMKALLFYKGVSANTKGDNGWSALHRACCEAHSDAAKLLIENGADVNARHDNGTTPLHDACADRFEERPREPVVQLLIENGANVNAETNSKDTPLHQAVADGQAGVTALLIQNGAKIHAKNEDGQTPLHWACDGLCRWEAAKVLIVNGADVNIKDKWGYSSFHLAFCEYSDYSWRSTGYDTIRLMIDYGADVHTKNLEGETVLCTACKNANWEEAKLLVKNGAISDINNGIDGKTPLHHACVTGMYKDEDLDMVELLLKNGANIHAKDSEGGTPLHWACNDERNLESIKFLVNAGADVNAADGNGMTPLHFACSREHSDRVHVVQFLLSRGANANEKTKEGSTPLQMASETNHLEIAWLLVRQCPWLVLERLD